MGRVQPLQEGIELHLAPDEFPAEDRFRDTVCAIFAGHIRLETQRSGDGRLPRRLPQAPKTANEGRRELELRLRENSPAPIG